MGSLFLKLTSANSGESNRRLLWSIGSDSTGEITLKLLWIRGSLVPSTKFGDIDEFSIWILVPLFS